MIYYEDIFSGKDKNDIRFFIQFLDALSKNLKINSPEVTVIKVLEELKDDILERLRISREKKFKLKNFDDFLVEIYNNTEIDLVRLLLGILIKLGKFSSEDYSKMISDISQELKFQQHLEREKKNILDGEKFKIKIIIFCLPFILSILTALLPLFILNNKYEISMENAFLSADFTRNFNHILFFMMNFIYVFISTYYLTKVAGILFNYRYCLISAFIFVLIYSLFYLL
ncbi:MAG: hypothetical protein ACFFCS_12330 [Candidatus Hodarchaeota archaeon]